MAVDVLQIVTDTDRRGAQVFATDLDDELTRRGRSVRTVALAPGAVGGLDVPVLGAMPKSSATLRALRREMQQVPVVVAHGSTTLPACALASLGTGVPFVYRQISDSRFWASSPARRARVRVGLARARRIVALWSGSAQVLVDHFSVRAEKISVVANGIPPERFAPSDDPEAKRRLLETQGLRPERFTVVYAGALAQEKGVDLAIEAVGGVPETQLLVVGDGTERDALEQRAARVAPGRVAFTGTVPQMAEYYAAADVVVLPSRGGDSMPATLIEAGMMAKPVIATPIDAIPEIVLDRSTGILVPVDDAFALRAAMAELFSDPGLGRRLGTEASVHCRAAFSIETVGEAWGATLDSVVGTGTGAR